MSTPEQPKRQSGRWVKGQGSPNPGGKKKAAFVPPASKPAPKPVKEGKKATQTPRSTQGGKKTPEPQVIGTGTQPPAPEVGPAPQPAPQPSSEASSESSAT
jgi:hypothetical protein